MTGTEQKKFVRSPFFYVGDKHKLLPQITPLFPKAYDRIIEPFVGGGSVFLNTPVHEVLANDIDSNVIDIHNLLYSQGDKMNQFISNLIDIIRSYDLSCSFMGDLVSEEIRVKFPKTYFAQRNRQGFTKLKENYNLSGSKETTLLYLLMIYGFNRMLRFNKKGQFNIPVGNVDFNSNVVSALLSYSKMTIGRNILFKSLDFYEFIESIEFRTSDFVYVDPPYLITGSEYNKNWNDDSERRLYNLLDQLDQKGIRFALSNVEIYGNRSNIILEEWMKKYRVSVITSNYINYFDNKKKALKEVLVYNYE